MVARPALIGVREEPELAEFDLLWSTHARDYIAVAIDALRRWRDVPEHHVAKISTPTFDEWLRSPAGIRCLSLTAVEHPAQHQKFHDAPDRNQGELRDEPAPDCRGH